MRPVIPRWTIHWAVDSCVGRALSPAVFFFGFEPRDLFRPLAGEGARPTRPVGSRLNTMCLPTRLTPAMRCDSSVATISAAGLFSGSGFDPSQTDSMTSPVTRLARPRAIVSTSGSSGMENSLQSSVFSRQPWPLLTTEDRRRTTALTIAHPPSRGLSLPVHISPVNPCNFNVALFSLGRGVCATLQCGRGGRHFVPRS
jgi:hypothetical protein